MSEFWMDFLGVMAANGLTGVVVWRLMAHHRQRKDLARLSGLISQLESLVREP